MPLELAHAQLLETGPVFQPMCESFSRDAPEINSLSVLPGYRPVLLPHVVSVRGAGGLVGSERGSLDVKNRSTAAFWGLKDVIFRQGS